VIEQVHIEQVACLKATDLQLTKLHALIGPNDSGKSLILKTIAATVDTASRRSAGIIDTAVPGRVVRLTTPNGAYRVQLASSGEWMEEQSDGSLILYRSEPVMDSPLDKELESAVVVDFDAQKLRATSELLPEEKHIGFLQSRGAGLPGIYDSILNAGDRSFYEISDALAALFPTVKRLRLSAVSSTHKQIEIELLSGERIPASSLSEGILYYLAYAALQYLRPTPILLIEEPENGLHPARIREVMGMLRQITEAPDGPQIVMATHSPLVINELQPEEVSVVTRTVAEGTKVTCIKDTRFFKERSEVLTLGELWLNYCDGIEEAPLLEGAEP